MRKKYLIAIEGRLYIVESTSPFEALRYQCNHWVDRDFDGREAKVYELGAPVVMNVNEAKP